MEFEERGLGCPRPETGATSPPRNLRRSTTKTTMLARRRQHRFSSSIITRARTKGVQQFVHSHPELHAPVLRPGAETGGAEVRSAKRRPVELVALAGEGERDRASICVPAIVRELRCSDVDDEVRVLDAGSSGCGLLNAPVPERLRAKVALEERRNERVQIAQ